jgi:hypothetical protein
VLQDRCGEIHRKLIGCLHGKKCNVGPLAVYVILQGLDNCTSMVQGLGSVERDSEYLIGRHSKAPVAAEVPAQCIQRANKSLIGVDKDNGSMMGLLSE